MTRAIFTQLSFADLELLSQVSLDEPLERISAFLDENASLVELVRHDLTKGLKNPRAGRDGITPEQVLRSFVLRSLKAWNLREVRARIADGLGLRLFARFFSRPVPKHDAFARAFNRLTPETTRLLNEAVVRAAVRLGLENPAKLRSDTTVVETDVHFPSDSTLLWDSVRVITRQSLQLKKLLPSAFNGFRDRTRSARRCLRKIQRMTPKQRAAENKPVYRVLIGFAEKTVRAAQAACLAVKQAERVDFIAAAQKDSLVAEISHYAELAGRVIDQARRRVLRGEEVPNSEKIFSIFEPHTDLIMRGKGQKPVEFGHKILLSESAAGLITEYKVLEGNPSDTQHVIPSLQKHETMFGAPPKLYAADRGFYTTANVEACRNARVGFECIPQRGGHKTPERRVYEKSPRFKAGQRFRAGIEGRISVLLRGRGMRRCLAKGPRRFEVFVGLAVLANNLLVIANLLSERKTRRYAPQPRAA